MNKLDETWLLGSLKKLAADRLSERDQKADSDRRLASLVNPEGLRRQDAMPDVVGGTSSRLTRKEGVPYNDTLGSTPRGPGGIEQLAPIQNVEHSMTSKAKMLQGIADDERARAQRAVEARATTRANNTTSALRSEEDAKFNMKWGAPGTQVFDIRGGNLGTALPNTVDQTGVRMGDRAGEQARGNLVSMGNEAVDMAGGVVGAGVLGTAVKGLATGGSLLAHGAKKLAPNPIMRPSWGQQVMGNVRGAVGSVGERIMETSPGIRAGVAAVAKAARSPIGKAVTHVGEHKLQHDGLHAGQSSATRLAGVSDYGVAPSWTSNLQNANPATSAPPAPMPASAQNTNVRPTPAPLSAQNTNVPAPANPVQTAMPVPKAMPSPVAPMSAQNTGMKPSPPSAVPKSSPAMPKPTASAAPVSPVVKTSAFVAYGNERFASSFGSVTDNYLRSRIPVVFA